MLKGEHEFLGIFIGATRTISIVLLLQNYNHLKFQLFKQRSSTFEVVQTITSGVAYGCRQYYFRILFSNYARIF